MTLRIFSPSIILLILFVSVRPVGARKATPQEEKYAIYRPLPAYPYRSRLNQDQGKGVCILRIDKETGSVTRVEIEDSTGSEELDRAAIKGFMKWRFVPKTLSAVRLPITFDLIGHQLHWERANAISAPPVRYPLACQRANIGGTGVYEFVVNFESGEVKDIKILQSAGDGRLNRAAVTAFRKWRFRPRTTHNFSTHFTFY